MQISIPTLQAGSITAVAHAYAGGRQASAMSYIWTSSSIGLAGSLLMYGVIGGNIGWRPVALGLSLLPVLLIPLILTMPTSPRTAGSRTIQSRVAESFRFLLRRRSLWIALVSTLSMSGAISALFLMPFVLRAQSFDAGATGLLLLSNVAGSVIGTPIIGNLADRFGPSRPLAAGLLLGGGALAALSFLATEPLVIVACLATLGGVMSGAQALLQSVAADLARKLGVGTAAALGGMRLAQAVGPTVGPTIAGIVYLRWGATPALLGVATLLVIAAALALRTLGEERTHVDVPAVPAPSF
jgi:predicted MFS family arabinose efflux permease